MSFLLCQILHCHRATTNCDACMPSQHGIERTRSARFFPDQQIGAFPERHAIPSFHVSVQIVASFVDDAAVRSVSNTTGAIGR